MDTKPPPIPQKTQERPQLRKQERATDVSLPPLTPLPNRRQRLKTPGTPWTRGPPYVHQGHSYQAGRPYRVLHIGATPLMHACQQADRTRVLRLLKDQEYTIGFRDRTLRNALHYCMDSGTGGAVATAAPELVNAPDAEGHTPLHLAVIAGDTQLVAVLLANGADVNAKDLEGHSVLHWATVCGEAECVRLVLSAGARPSTPDLRGGSPLHYAAQCCGAAATAELAVPKKVGLKVLQTLLEFGGNVNAKDEDGRQPILWAASAGSVEALLALARAGGSAAAGASDKDGLTALHCAASRGHARCVEALVNLCGSQPDHVDDNGCSALHYAATLGHADATALLLRLGADPNRQDRKGRTPALCAAAKGQLETLKLLAQHGGSLHARTVRGTGVAHEAASSGRVELIKWLAKKRPSTLDVATHDGRTPLHVAALHGHVDACKVLLDHGARFNATLRTSKGNLMTALDAALHRGHRDCAKLIQMHGGTTAQQLRTLKTAPNKVFGAKHRLNREETSTDSDSSTPRRRRRRRSTRDPDVYYEEHWSQRRTRRKTSLRKPDRRGSRSYSDEDIRPSKRSRDRERRTRSESARYESDREDRGKKNRSKRNAKKHKHEYSESSTGSESQSSSRKPKKEVAVEDERDASQRSNHEEHSVSDDSLEVVIVKKSIERKSEKLKSKSPRDAVKSSVDETITCTKSKTRKRSSRRKSKDKTPDAKENRTKTDGKESRMKESSEETDEALQGEVDSEQKLQYRQEVTDSTSQEAVEHVTVQAMVHKDQTPETSDEVSSKNQREEEKLTKEAGEPQKRTRPRSARPGSSRPRGPSAKSKMDHILEKADEMQSALMQKAADLKKGMEEMRQNTPEEVVDVQEKKSGRTKELNELKADAAGSEETDDEEKRHIEEEATESETPSEDSQKGSSSMQKTSEKKHDKENIGQSPRTSHDKSSVHEEPAAEKSDSIQLEENSSTQSPDRTSLRKPRNKRKSKNEGDSTPRTVVQDIPQSGSEDKSVDHSQDSESPGKSSESKSRPSTARDKSSRGSTSPKKSPEIGAKRRSKRSELESGKTSGAEADQGKTEKASLEKGTSECTEEKRPDDKTTESHQKKTVNDRTTESSEKEAPDSVSKKPSDEKKTEASRKQMSSKSLEDHQKQDLNESMLRTGGSHPDEDENLETREVPSGKDSTELLGSFSDERLSASPAKAPISLGEDFKFIDDSGTERKSSGSSGSPRKKHSRPSTAKNRSTGRPAASKLNSMESSEECSPDRSAIVAVIESPEWGEEEDDDVDKEIQEAIGDDVEQDTEPEDNSMGVMRVLPSTSEDETPRTVGLSRTSGIDSLPQVHPRPRPRLLRAQSPQENRRGRPRTRQRRDSGGRDSGIEPSPRISRIPKRTTKIYPNTEKHQALNMETVTRDVQISLRRYHLERKIFFQLMELKRLQIRHGRTNEHVLVKRQVEAFHKAGATGPTLGVAKYEQPLTFRHFEAFLYEQLRRLQKRPATPEWCAEAKQCTQKTHRCHHATSAYTSVPVYTYLGGLPERGGSLLPKIHARGKGQMTVEVSHGEEKQVIALPAEKLDRGKRYFVTFTVRGDNQEPEGTKASSQEAQRPTKSV